VRRILAAAKSELDTVIGDTSVLRQLRPEGSGMKSGRNRWLVDSPLQQAGLEPSISLSAYRQQEMDDT